MSVEAWIAALVRVVDRTDLLTDVTDVSPEVWEGAAYESYAAASTRIAVEVAQGQEAVRRAARALLVFAEDPTVEAEVRLADRLATAHPGAPVPTASNVPDASTPASELLAWWRGLSRVEREEFRVVAGGGLGSALAVLPGLPSAAKDRVNRDALALDLARGRGEPERRTAVAVRRALSPSYARDRVLLAYDAQAAGRDGEVVVGVGDVDGAERVVAVVPGITTEAMDAPRYVRDVEALVAEADAAAGDRGETAGVFWLGYDAPDGFTDPATWSEGRARDGGEALADDVAGVVAVRAAARGDDGPGRVSVVGHSYGSTVVSYAGSGPGLDVDAVALVGSPGAGPAEHAGDLGVREVYVGRDSRDPVAALGDEGWVGKGGVGLGRDPASDDFGAVRFRAEREGREASWGLVDAHTSYLDPGTESHSNLARVVAGRPDLIEVAEHAHDPWWRGPRDPEWARRVR